ncbi:MAG: zinc ribbon domain-containing protein [Gammaproteobacteria bacterium]|nr:zinc ribbon domain-containing protein [Gammaproteobacteria bacterium]
MPAYDYYCNENRTTVEVVHPVNTTLKTWGEVCFVAQISLGDTDPLAPVRKLIRAPYLARRIGNSQLRETGFTKLVRRDKGLYENVTAAEGEARFLQDQDGPVPAFTDKIRD